MNSSSASRARRKRARGCSGRSRGAASGKAVIGVDPVARRSRSGARSAPSRSSSWTPKTARMITARVIRWVWGRSANGSPTGQLSISRRVDLADQLAVALRSARRGRAAAAACAGACAAPRRGSGPSSGRAPAPARSRSPRRRGSCSGEPVKTRFDQAGLGDVDEPAEVGEARGEDVAVAALAAGSGSRAGRARSGRLHDAGALEPGGSRVGAARAREGRLLHRAAPYAKTG